ncbi:MAG: OmpA family protein [Halioglobus sp.]|nr:OmpA family protein [Halioglobus sp.]
MKLKNRTMTVTGAALLLLCGAVPMQAENVHLGKDVASREEIIELLMPSSGQHKVRGLRLRDETATAPGQDHVEQVESAAVDAGPRSISLEIYFDFDSAALSGEAIEQLAPVGEALRSQQLQDLAFELEGHTDASGGEEYNLGLSERRAESVRQFFMQEYGITSDRLASVGRGETDLLDPENPNSGINRRVKIIAQ